jgi:hypothetical protein
LSRIGVGVGRLGRRAQATSRALPRLLNVTHLCGRRWSSSESSIYQAWRVLSSIGWGCWAEGRIGGGEEEWGERDEERERKGGDVY